MHQVHFPGCSTSQRGRAKAHSVIVCCELPKAVCGELPQACWECQRLGTRALLGLLTSGSAQGVSGPNWLTGAGPGFPWGRFPLARGHRSALAPPQHSARQVARHFSGWRVEVRWVWEERGVAWQKAAEGRRLAQTPGGWRGKRSSAEAQTLTGVSA